MEDLDPAAPSPDPAMGRGLGRGGVGSGYLLVGSAGGGARRGWEAMGRSASRGRVQRGAGHGGEEWIRPLHCPPHRIRPWRGRGSQGGASRQGRSGRERWPGRSVMPRMTGKGGMAWEERHVVADRGGSGDRGEALHWGWPGREGRPERSAALGTAEEGSLAGEGRGAAHAVGEREREREEARVTEYWDLVCGNRGLAFCLPGMHRLLVLTIGYLWD